jgi:hypothetical protein
MNRAVLVLFVSVVVAESSYTCAVPVFRYALEEWPADSIQIEIVHSYPLSGDAKAAADLLVGYEEDHTLPANFTLSFGKPSKEKTGGAQGDAGRPSVTVYLPAAPDSRETAWRAPLSRESVERIVDSPARREVVKLLTGGVAAVWLFLPGGDRGKDEEGWTVLEKELADLRGTIELPGDPMADTWDEKDLGKGPSLDIVFSAVRIDRNDPAEEFLIQSLLRVEPDLAKFSDQPMAFPVFGRGRVLYALVGKGINTDTIREACSFITGPCSCLVKELNPGVDLLLRADWEGSIGERMATGPTASMLLGVGSLLASDEPRPASMEAARAELLGSTYPAPSLVSSRSALEAASEPAEATDRLVPVVFIALGGCAVIVGIGTLAISRSKGQGG